MPLPQQGAFTLADVSVPACLVEGFAHGAADHEGVVRLDLGIADGRLAAPSGVPSGEVVAMAGRMVWPAPIDVHTHLDKGHIWPRARNADGSFASALERVRRDRETHWRAEDVAARMDFALCCAWAHGTAAVRTHLDSSGPQAAISWPVFAAARERWDDRITLQAVSIAVLDDYAGAKGAYLADLVAEHGGILGLVPWMVDDLGPQLDRFLNLAAERGLDVDLHVDESLDPASTALRELALAVRRTGFAGRVVAGHCCSLGVQDEAFAFRTLDLVAEAGIAIVSLPLCNLYLQDRLGARTPRRRGITLLHEMRARGIDVMVASDNTRDPFYAYGDLDLHEVFRAAVRIGHLDHPFGDWPSAVTATPARIMGLGERGVIRPGAPADLVIFQGRSFSEVLSRPESRRTILRGGRVSDAAPPAYAELDPLFA
ncbi:MAG: cytosine deaminase [Geminicoccaceae bacterium]|nr:MAG: cytosine deaminase [Geminicoccaceae bacterium]